MRKPGEGKFPAGRHVCCFAEPSSAGRGSPIYQGQRPERLHAQILPGRPRYRKHGCGKEERQAEDLDYGSSSPCLSAFKPVVFGFLEAPVFSDPEASLNYWLDREYLQRAIYAGLVGEGEYKNRLQKLEAAFLSEAESLEHAADEDFRKFVISASKEEQGFIESYREKIEFLKKNPQALPRLWRKITARLGKNVFERHLSARI